MNKITVNGVTTISSGSITVIDGKIIGNTSLTPCSIDEKRSICTSQNIEINSMIADVNILLGDVDSIEAHLYGECSFDGKIPELRVKTSVSGNALVDVVWAGGCLSGKLNLDVRVPRREYDEISVKTASGDITMDNISSKAIKTKSQSGDMELCFEGRSLITSTMSGDIDVEFTATYPNPSLSIKTMSGDVHVSLAGLSELDLNASSMSGKTKSRFRGSEAGFAATALITTMSGDITIS